MKFDTAACGTAEVIVPRGALVTDDAADFLHEVQAAIRTRSGRVVIDMSGVPYFDSAGIQAVLTLYGTDRAAPFRPKLAALTETCRDALDLTNVIARLDVFDTVENAVRSYSP